MAKPGRKPLYTPDRVTRICNAIERGETQERAAEMGGISKTVYYEWLKEKSEFADAVKKAKAAFEEWQMSGILEDAKRSLKTLICGLEYEEVKTEYEQDPKNPNNPRIKKQTRTNKKILPSPTAVIFALCNRDPEHWQNRISNEISGKIDTESKNNVSLAKVSDELLAQVIDAINSK